MVKTPSTGTVTRLMRSSRRPVTAGTGAVSPEISTAEARSAFAPGCFDRMNAIYRSSPKIRPVGENRDHRERDQFDEILVDDEIVPLGHHSEIHTE